MPSSLRYFASRPTMGSPMVPVPTTWTMFAMGLDFQNPEGVFKDSGRRVVLRDTSGVAEGGPPARSGPKNATSAKSAKVATASFVVASFALVALVAFFGPLTREPIRLSAGASGAAPQRRPPARRAPRRAQEARSRPWR